MDIPLSLTVLPYIVRSLRASRSTVRAKSSRVASEVFIESNGYHSVAPQGPIFPSSLSHSKDAIYCLDPSCFKVCSVWRVEWLFFRRNVSLAIVRAGLAMVYDSHGAVYGDIKDALVKAEHRARYV